jgi:cell division protein FtsB
MKESKTNPKKFFEWILILLSFYIIFSLSRSLWEFFGVSSRLDNIKEELVLEEKKKDFIEARIEEATSEAYVEKVARNELNMQKEEDVVVMLLNNEKFSSDNNSQDLKVVEKDKPNWEKWWELVF